ncbi:MAG: DUF692 domain-containing protein [Oligoflexales bacterium]
MNARKISKLGIGLSYIPDLRAELLAHLDEIDFFEFYSESFFYPNFDPIQKKIIAEKPMVMHGLDMSLGEIVPANQKHQSQLAKAVKNYQPKWFSDHLCMTKSSGEEVGHLMPIEFNDEVLENICKKITEVSELCDLPFLIENITYYYQLPFATYGECEFISKVVENSDCGILLDVNNLYINSVNHRYDPYSFIDHLPHERIIEVHIAGGSRKLGMMVDTHANKIQAEVWALLEYVMRRTSVKGVVLERDANIPPIKDILAELAYAREIAKRTC